MLKVSVLLLVGTWLSFPGDFLHQKFTQLFFFSAIWHRHEMQTAFQLSCFFQLYYFQSYGSNEMWKPTLLILGGAGYVTCSVFWPF